MRKQKKYHYIYRTTCLITNKFYVGMHSTDNLDDGYLGSGKILGYSRRKYGDENHIIEIVEHVDTREALKLREKEIVDQEMLDHPLNMNLKYGGEGGGLWYGHQNSLNALLDPEIKRKAARLGNESRQKRMLNPEYACAYGKKLSDSVKGKQPWLGKNHSEETRAKLRTSMQGLQEGEKNSQYGSCWVTDGVKPIKIKKEQLDEYIGNGYSRGRKSPCSSVAEHSPCKR